MSAASVEARRTPPETGWGKPSQAAYDGCATQYQTRAPATTSSGMDDSGARPSVPSRSVLWPQQLFPQLSFGEYGDELLDRRRLETGEEFADALFENVTIDESLELFTKPPDGPKHPVFVCTAPAGHSPRAGGVRSKLSHSTSPLEGHARERSLRPDAVGAPHPQGMIRAANTRLRHAVA